MCTHKHLTFVASLWFVIVFVHAGLYWFALICVLSSPFYVLVFVGVPWHSLVFFGVHWYLLVFVGDCWCLLVFVGGCWCLLVFVVVCCCLLVFVGVCWSLLVFVGVCSIVFHQICSFIFFHVDSYSYVCSFVIVHVHFYFFMFVQVYPFLLNHVHSCSTHSQSKMLYPTCQYNSKLRTVRSFCSAFSSVYIISVIFLSHLVYRPSSSTTLSPKKFSSSLRIGFALAYWNQLSLVIQAWGHKTEHHCQPFSY